MSKIQENAKIINAVAARLHEAKRQFHIAMRRAKNDREHALSEIALLMDDIRGQGYDPESPAGYAMLVELMKARLPQEGQIEFCDKDGFPNRGGEL